MKSTRASKRKCVFMKLCFCRWRNRCFVLNFNVDSGISENLTSSWIVSSDFQKNNYSSILRSKISTVYKIFAIIFKTLRKIEKLQIISEFIYIFFEISMMFISIFIMYYSIKQYIFWTSEKFRRTDWRYLNYHTSNIILTLFSCCITIFVPILSFS